MVDGHRQGATEFGTPIRQGLVLAGIDQIETDPVKTVAGHGERPLGLRHRMQPPQRLQVGVVQRLNAHRHPVDPRLAIGAKAARLDRRGVRLQRHFGVIAHRPGGADPVQDGRDQFRVHQAGGAAAEKHGLQDAALGICTNPVNFGKVGCLPARLVNLCRDMAVEIAIGALRLAKRPMQIQAKAAVAPVFHDQVCPSL